MNRKGKMARISSFLAYALVEVICTLFIKKSAHRRYLLVNQQLFGNVQKCWHGDILIFWFDSRWTKGGIYGYFKKCRKRWEGRANYLRSYPHPRRFFSGRPLEAPIHCRRRLFDPYVSCRILTLKGLHAEGLQQKIIGFRSTSIKPGNCATSHSHTQRVVGVVN